MCNEAVERLTSVFTSLPRSGERAQSWSRALLLCHPMRASSFAIYCSRAVQTREIDCSANSSHSATTRAPRHGVLAAR
ncbi:hypothetical protein BAUCODRAFT_303169 [Baudoinia panamericana UAMH 10762]|uniref:Uncharacterized protein n=1 Tax=Baudoinia panamericana (strain UAMH 10762) TaxID=717646 RepID=M2MZI1_BAUPA|nr:uncharacterized protein BAUCODRAFT_303169 [Baudoinia panamericana UAMH 10762]EMC91750.1 hypothetical protein BAUCODRAFT_303169 [Baudoinia panamericana UAMH 10762]